MGIYHIILQIVWGGKVLRFPWINWYIAKHELFQWISNHALVQYCLAIQDYHGTAKVFQRITVYFSIAKLFRLKRFAINGICWDWDNYAHNLLHYSIQKVSVICSKSMHYSKIILKIFVRTINPVTFEMILHHKAWLFC